MLLGLWKKKQEKERERGSKGERETEKETETEFMQVGIDVKCMHTNFGGYALSGFGDIATFKNAQFSLSDHGL